MPTDESTDASTDQLIPEAHRLGDLVNGHPEHIDDVVPRLVAILTATDHPQVVHAAVDALGHAWHSSAATALLHHVAPDHPDSHVRLSLAQALPGGVDDVDATDDLRDRVIDVLIHLTRDPEPPVRDWAAFGLGQLQARSLSALDALAARLADPDPDTRGEALLALAEAGDQRALPVLRRRLEDGEDLFRLELEAAAALAAPELHPALQQLGEDWAGDQDEFSDLLATALARCAPEAATTARQVEQDVLTQVHQLVGASKQVGLDGGYPRTVLIINSDSPSGSSGTTGGGQGEDFHLALWDESQRPGEYPTHDVINAVRGSSTQPQA
ncbi:HEAT repeat domain-containing protein [Kineococcus sp. R86509]|uniref:HEAT repeat domain-containing protein n=1 Tax=Kineococcus sp. R86509 TaxID=3093851 RepID=UPI0036D27392